MNHKSIGQGHAGTFIWCNSNKEKNKFPLISLYDRVKVHSLPQKPPQILKNRAIFHKDRQADINQTLFQP